MKIKGPFEVDLKPMDSYTDGSDGNSLGRMSIDKTFSGELSGTSKGQMLTAMTDVDGSAGYVAIEQVVGEISGKKGSFVLQHFGTMSRGSDRLILEVVADSGTGELKGLSGEMKIIREGGKHFYEFDFDLAP